MKALLLIFGFISEAWGLLFKLALVVIAIAIVVGFFLSCSGGGLNEHSSCQQFQQADTSSQDKALQDMMNAHHDQGSLSLTRASVELYCAVHDSDSPIDGIYNSSNAGRQPAQALHVPAALAALVYDTRGRQAWPEAAA